MKEKLLGIDEVARYLKIPKSTIYKLSQKKKIPSCKIGKQLRFKKDSLDSWLARKEGLEAGQLIAQKVTPPKKAKNILLVDDDVLVLRAISKLLNSCGYNVESAFSAKEAVEKVKKRIFDLWLVDVRLPEMDGIEAVKRMREIYRRRRKPAAPEIMITGFMDPQAERRGQDIGIKEYLYKPFVNTEFIEAVQRKLGE